MTCLQRWRRVGLVRVMFRTGPCLANRREPFEWSATAETEGANQACGGGAAGAARTRKTSNNVATAD
jgi:hypothetical protein